MRRIVALLLSIMISLATVSYVATENAGTKVAVGYVEGAGKVLDVSIVAPDIYDFGMPLHIGVVVQRADTMKPIEPDNIVVRLKYFGFTMAEANLGDATEIAPGVYDFQFPAVGFPLVPDVEVEVYWTAPSGEKVVVKKEKSVILGFFYNITGKLIEWFKSFFGSFNLSLDIATLFDNFTKLVARWSEGFQHFLTLSRLVLGNLFRFLHQVDVHKAYIVQIPTTTTYPVNASDLEDIMRKAKLNPQVYTIVNYNDFFSLIWNDSLKGITVVIASREIPIPDGFTPKDWIYNMTIELCEKGARLIMFSEPFRYFEYQNATVVDYGMEGWWEFLKASGIELINPKMWNYTVLSSAELVGTTLIDKLLEAFNISAPGYMVADVVAYPSALPNDYAYVVKGTDWAVLVRIDSPAGITFVGGIPYDTATTAKFAFGMFGWQILDFLDRLWETVKSEVFEWFSSKFAPVREKVDALIDALRSGNLTEVMLDSADLLLEISDFLGNPIGALFSIFNHEVFSGYIDAIVTGDLGSWSGAEEDYGQAFSDLRDSLMKMFETLLGGILTGGLQGLLNNIATAVRKAKEGVFNITKLAQTVWEEAEKLKNVPIIGALPQTVKSAANALAMAAKKYSLIRKVSNPDVSANPITKPTVMASNYIRQAGTVVSRAISILGGVATISSYGLSISASEVSEAVALLDEAIAYLDNASKILAEAPEIFANETGIEIPAYMSIFPAYNISVAEIERLKQELVLVRNNLTTISSSGIGARISVEDIWNAINKLKDWVKSAIDNVLNKLEEFANWAKEKLEDLWNKLQEFFDLAKSWLENLWNAVYDKVVQPFLDALSEFRDMIVDAFGRVLNWFKEKLTWLWEQIKEPLIRIWNYIRNIPDYVLEFFDKIGDRFLEIVSTVARVSVQYVVEKALAMFGINYRRVLAVLTNIWDAILKIADFITSAVIKLPELFRGFAERVKNVTNVIISFIKEAFWQFVGKIENLTDRFMSLVDGFNYLVGFLGMAKDFLEQLTNISTWMGVIRYALRYFGKTPEILDRLMDVARDIFQLQSASVGKSINIVAVRGTNVYFTYMEKGRLMSGAVLNVTVATEDRVYGWVFASEVGTGVYMIDLADVGLTQGEFILIAEKVSLSASAAGDPTEETYAAATVKIEEPAPEEGAFAGKVYVIYPEVLRADRENTIQVVLENDLNTYSQVQVEILLIRDIAPAFYDKKTVKVAPLMNTTVSFNVVPILSAPLDYKLRVIVGGRTEITVTVRIAYGPINWAVAGVFLFIFLGVIYAVTSDVARRLRRR